MIILSIRRKEAAGNAGQGEKHFKEGVHYTLLKEPVATRGSIKVEVVAAFSCGCARCYHLESLLFEWRREQKGDVDFWNLHAVWNQAMKLYARAFCAAKRLHVFEATHLPPPFHRSGDRA